jgi:ubiquinone biosynthesis protein COQ9
MADTNAMRELIVDTALALGGARSWEAVRLHEVADAAGITLEDVRQHFREKEEVVDAWFDRADRAMLLAAEDPAFAALTVRERLHLLVMTWLATLAPHRRVTRQMIYGKMEPGHVHIQIPGLMRVSRTVQWMREAARHDATYVRRALEETAMTSIYLMTFFYWMRDESPESANTARFLDGWLARAESAALRLYAGGAGPAPAKPPADESTSAAEGEAQTDRKGAKA